MEKERTTMLPRLLIPVILAATLAACVTTDGPRDVKGQSLKIEDKGTFQPIESRFNTFAFLTPSKEYITHARQRNNGQGWVETITWDSGRSFIEIEFLTTAWFSINTEERMADRTIFSQLAKKFPVSGDSYAELDQVSPRTKGWLANTGKCSVGGFAKRFKSHTPYDNDRGWSDAVVRFGTCGDNFTVSPEELVQKIDLITEADKVSIAAAFADVGPLPGAQKSGPKKPLTTMKGSWQGVSDELSGVITRETAAQTEFKFTLSEQNAECSGITVNAEKTTETGRWKITCTNGLSADGIWTNRSFQNFIGSGSDTEKRKIMFELIS
ncbi:hypothetical protein ACTU44_09995 [Thalassospira sp. SM2505]